MTRGGNLGPCGGVVTLQPDCLLQYLMMHWITSFQMFRQYKGGWHRLS